MKHGFTSLDGLTFLQNYPGTEATVCFVLWRKPTLEIDAHSCGESFIWDLYLTRQ